MSYANVVLEALWFILPAYIANAVPVLVNGRRPIDNDRKMADGRPIFGRGKTWEGTISAVIAGALVGYLQAFSGLLPSIPTGLAIGMALGAGAIAGDMLASFFKRRAGLKRGVPVLFLDQLDFVAGAFAVALLITSISLEWLLVWLVLTPILHKLTNKIGYIWGLKKVPW